LIILDSVFPKYSPAPKLSKTIWLKNQEKGRFHEEIGLFSGQSVNNAFEQAQFKNVAKPMFSGRKRTGFS